MVILELKGMNWIVADLVRTAVAVGVATASYYVVERYFLRIKARRWSSHADDRTPRPASPADPAHPPLREAAA
jgi:peptidoglycan/LPS O-acetylase OafA/YrhL